MKYIDFKYRPEIDGLRAIAVIVVVLYHAGLGFTGGYVGVDVFFVISGYLITKLILKDLELNRFSIFDFWERRIRRIFPALYVMVAATLIAGYFLLLPWDYEALGRSAIMQSIFSSNFHFWSESGYFDGPAEMKPLLHTWSLAVEEQFYFIFPALMVLLWKRSILSAKRVIFLLWWVSFAASVVGVFYFASATFYLLPMRAWELLSGALLAIGFTRLNRLSQPVRELFSSLGLIMIIVSSLVYTEETRFPGVAALLPCLGTVFFIFANERKVTLAGRLMSLKPIVFVGLISYSLYLWHWPLIAFSNRITSDYLDTSSAFIIVGLSFICAVLSWQYVEKPFRKGGFLKTRRKIFQIGGLTALVTIVSGALLDAFDGLPVRVPDAVMEMGIQERNPRYREKTSIEQIEQGDLLQLGEGGEEAKNAIFLLWGDSHAVAIAPMVNKLSEEFGVNGVACLRGGTPPLLDVWVNNTNIGRAMMAYNRAVVDFVVENQIPNVIIAGRWAKYINGDEDGPLSGVVVDTASEKATADGAVQAFESGLRRSIVALSNSGTRIFLLMQVPDHQVDVPLLIADRIWRGKPLHNIGITKDEYMRAQEQTHAVLYGLEGENLMLMDPAPLLFDHAGEPVLLVDGKSIYRDEDHISDAGAYYIESVMRAAFIEMMQTAKR
jgi:peptidoglycan/LPS O-acetylase OafA/YrhL